MAASLLAPAAIGAASPAHRARPRSEIVRLVADPASVIAGDDVELKVVGGPPAGRYLWSVGGKRVATRQPELKLRLAAPGLVHVAVRIRVAGKRVGRARTTIGVRRDGSVVRSSDAAPRQ